MHGPQNPFPQQLHATKYRQPGETFEQAIDRIAFALKDPDKNHNHEFRDILLDMRFMPAGRVQAAMGADRDVTPYNCYVSGTIPDSFTQRDNDDQSSIMDRAWEAAQTMRMGGGIGYDFSTLRPSGALIKKLQSNSSGPISFMHIFDAVCKATSSAGHRRGAQMGVLRVDHPDVHEFVHSKQDQKTLSGFNISVAITDEFMDAVANKKPFDLRFGGEVHKTIDAAELWEDIMKMTWDWADPGVLFIDTINKMNNLWYCENIAATNPCGEQPLPPFGACLLGSFNLAKYIQVVDNKAYFDFFQLQCDIPHVVRAQDNIVDRARYPLFQQEQEAKNKRRMGLGVTGLANAAETLGYLYGSQEFLDFQETVMFLINDCCYAASARLAAEKGSFPLFDPTLYMQSRFVQSIALSEETRDLMKRFGMRNSHLTSIAPTGTISMSADNVSSGIEPVFDYVTKRPVNMPGGPVVVDLPDYAYAKFGTQGKLAGGVTAKEHVAVLTTAARLVDSAVSKTCNVDGKMPWEEFKNIYWSAWEGGAKGCTTFNQDGKKLALLLAASKTKDEEVEPEKTEGACTFDPDSGRRSCE